MKFLLFVLSSISLPLFLPSCESITSLCFSCFLFLREKKVKILKEAIEWKRKEKIREKLKTKGSNLNKEWKEREVTWQETEGKELETRRMSGRRKFTPMNFLLSILSVGSFLWFLHLTAVLESDHKSESPESKEVTSSKEGHLFSLKQWKKEEVLFDQYSVQEIKGHSDDSHSNKSLTLVAVFKRKERRFCLSNSFLVSYRSSSLYFCWSMR